MNIWVDPIEFHSLHTEANSHSLAVAVFVQAGLLCLYVGLIPWLTGVYLFTAIHRTQM